MDPQHITQQTSTLELRTKRADGAPDPITAPSVNIRGPLQWLLEGPGWGVLRPAVEFLLLCVAAVVALGGMHATLHVSAVSAPVLALPPLVVLLFYLRGGNRTRLRSSILESLAPVISAVSVAAMTVAILGLFANGQSPHPSLWLHAWLYALIAVGAGRVCLVTCQRWARSRRLIGKPVLIMGAGMVGSQVARRLDTHREYGLIPVGFLDHDPRSMAEVGGRVRPVLGTVDDLDAAVRETDARNLIVAFSSAADARVSRLIQRCLELGIEVSVVPRMFDTINNRVGYDSVGGLPLLSFSSINPNGLQFAIKYAIDRLVAGCLLAALSPFLLIAALAVKLSTGGPVLFCQPRVGLDGHEFEMLKFRTMRGSPAKHGENDADWAEWILRGDDDVAYATSGSSDENETSRNGATATSGSGAADGNGSAASDASEEDDDRRTRVGRVLRSVSIDELPQLWNVLKGDMSLIGPRPERPSYVRQFEPVVYRYQDRHRVRSGMTGWAQVHGLRGRTSLAERVEWDNYYIAHWSLGLDLRILALTMVALFHNPE